MWDWVSRPKRGRRLAERVALAKTPSRASRWTIRAIGFPSISSAEYPKILRAPSFQKITQPWLSAAITASVEDWATERKRISDSRSLSSA